MFTGTTNGFFTWLEEQEAHMQMAFQFAILADEISEENQAKILDCLRNPASSVQPFYGQNYHSDDPLVDSFRLKSIEEVQNCAAISSRVPLSFEATGENDLNVVYGQNGSGKSSYIRILKHACAAREAGKLYGNVFSDSQEQQLCTFVLGLSSGTDQRIAWTKDDPKNPLLRNIDIFDAHCGRLYTLGNNEYAYEPPELLAFTTVSKAFESIYKKLQEEIDQRKAIPFPLEHQFASSSIYVGLQKIDYSWDNSKVLNLITFNGDTQKELDSIERILSIGDPESRLQVLCELVQKKERLKSNLTNALETCSNEIFNGIQISKQELKNSLALLEEYRQRISDEDVFKGVGNELWMKMWRAATEFANSISEQFPPVNTSTCRCPLCKQELSDDTIRRFDSFAEFFENELVTKVANAERELRKRIDGIENLLDDKSFEQRLMDMSFGTKEEITSVAEAYISFHLRHKQYLIELRDIHTLNPTRKPEEYDSCFAAFNNIFENSVQKDKDEIDRIKVSMQNHGLLKQRQTELIALKHAREKEEELKSYLANLKACKKLEEEKEYFSTQKLSLKKTQLSQDMLESGFMNRFETEIAKLGAERLNVTASSRTNKGNLTFSLKLGECKQKDIKIPDILSEGEQRIITLAAFLANILASKRNTPIILDDPVSSLDHLFEDEVIKRLVELSKERQIIVFTHQLTVLYKLFEVGKNKIGACQVKQSPSGKYETGVVTSELPYNGRKPDKLLNDSKEKIEKAIKGYNTGNMPDSDLETCRVHCFGMVRMAIELLVEGTILNGTVRRYEKAVHMNNLHKVLKFSAEDFELIDRLYTAYSNSPIHSNPETICPKERTPRQIVDDIDELLKWKGEFATRALP